MNEKPPEQIYVWQSEPYQWHETKTAESDVEYVRADLLATARKEAREAAFKDAAITAPAVVISHTPGCGDAIYCDCGAQEVRNEIVAALERTAAT